MSITYLMLASPNFLFPQGHHDINTTEVSVGPLHANSVKFKLISPFLQAKLKPTAGQLASNSTLKQLLSYQLIRDRMPHDTYMSLINLEDDTTPVSYG